MFLMLMSDQQRGQNKKIKTLNESKSVAEQGGIQITR